MKALIFFDAKNTSYEGHKETYETHFCVHGYHVVVTIIKHNSGAWTESVVSEPKLCDGSCREYGIDLQKVIENNFNAFGVFSCIEPWDAWLAHLDVKTFEGEMSFDTSHREIGYGARLISDKSHEDIHVGCTRVYCVHGVYHVTETYRHDDNHWFEISESCPGYYKESKSCGEFVRLPKAVAKKIRLFRSKQ